MVVATLNLGNGSGDFVPFVKYNGKAGRWYIKGADGNEQEVVNPSFVADFAKIQTGWFYFNAGQAPEKVLDPSLTEAAPKPVLTYTDDKGKVRDCFKRGFVLHLFSPKNFGGVVELSSTAQVMLDALKGLWAQYATAPEAAQGKLPVVAVSGVLPVQSKQGTNYSPVMSITGWVDRPADFDAAAPVSAPLPPPVAAPVVQSTGISEF